MVGVGRCSLQLAALLLITGCAAERSVDEQFAAAEMAIAKAEQSGVADTDFLGLVQAEKKLKRAEDAVRRNDSKAAQRLAGEAEIDALQTMQEQEHHSSRQSR
jgi:hypothetical protein